MATINQTLLADIFRTFSGVFNKAANGPREMGKRDITEEQLAMIIRSSGAATTHAWINQIPGFKKWASARTVNALTAGKMTVVNEDWEDTVSVPRNAVEDDEFQVFAPVIAAMGAASRDLWLEMAIDALEKNGEWADGYKFFGAGRILITDTTNGNTTLTNAVKTAFSADALQTAITAMRGWKLDGKRSAGVLPKYLLVGPDLEATAAKVCESQLIADVQQTTVGSNTTVTGTTVSNPLQGVLQVKVHPGIATGHWYVLAEKNGVKAVAVQKRKEASLTAMTSETDDNVFHNNTYYYGAHARGEAFLTLPFLAYAGGLSTVPTAHA